MTACGCGSYFCISHNAVWEWEQDDGFMPPLKPGEPSAFDRLCVHPDLLKGRETE